MRYALGRVAKREKLYLDAARKRQVQFAGTALCAMHFGDYRKAEDFGIEALGLRVIGSNDCHVMDFQEFHEESPASLRAGKANKKTGLGTVPGCLRRSHPRVPLHGVHANRGLFLARAAGFK